MASRSGWKRPAQRADKEWAKLQSKAKTDLDDDGAPILEMQLSGRPVRVGAAPENVFDGSAPPQLVREILEARLQSELRHCTSRGLSRSEVTRDLNLLQQAQRELAGKDSPATGVDMPTLVRAAFVNIP